MWQPDTPPTSLFKSIKNYNYFAYPDGEDIVNKTLVLNRWSFFSGIFIGTFDAMTYSKVTTVSGYAGRYAYHLVPLMGAATAFEITKDVMAQIRKKQDPWNWVIGGIAAGTVLGTWYRSRNLGVFSSLTFCVFGAAKQHTHSLGWGNILFPNDDYFKVPVEQAGLWYRDCSLTKERPRNWAPGASYDQPPPPANKP